MAIVASSRLVFAVARDGVLPLSSWVGTVDKQGQPRNAVTVIYVSAALLLCTILPSQVAFTSLVSAAGVPTIAAYGLIGLLRFVMTPDRFGTSRFRLGRYAKPFYVCAALFNGFIFAVRRGSLSLSLVLRARDLTFFARVSFVVVRCGAVRCGFCRSTSRRSTFRSRPTRSTL